MVDPSIFCRRKDTVLIRHFTMSTPSQPRGTKRSFDTLIHVMDRWLKQEVDALSLKILQVQAENKRLKRRNGLLEMHREQATTVIRELRQESDFRQLLIHEIFNNHPEVHEEYTVQFRAEEELDPEATEEDSDWTEFDQDELVEPGENA